MSDTGPETGGSRTTRTWWRLLGSIVAVGVLVICTWQVASIFARSTETTRETVDADGVDRIDVRTGSGDVSVLGADRDDISIVAVVEHGLQRTRTTVELTEGTLRVSSGCPLLSGRCSVSYRIEAPRELAVAVQTSNGQITARDLTASAELHSSNGDVEATAITGRLEMSSSNGDIAGTSLTTDDVQADSSNGDVLVELLTPPRRAVALSDNGDVTVWLPDSGETYDLDMSTDNGRREGQIRTDPDATRTVTIRSDNGDVTVGYRPR